MNAELGDIVLVRYRDSDKEWPAIVSDVGEGFLVVTIFARPLGGGTMEGVVVIPEGRYKSAQRWTWRPKPARA